MALLVPNIGELESLRYLVSQQGSIGELREAAPRNLILKLFTSNTTPQEGDVPSQGSYFEPYATGNTPTYGTAPSTGYPACINNRGDQAYNQNYGILLNGSRWKIATNPGGTETGGGAGPTTATYPEQTFTFTSDAGSVYGYYLVRANNMPVTVQGVPDAGTVAANTQITKTGCVGAIGTDYIILPYNDISTTITGSAGAFSVTVGSAAGIAAGQEVQGTGIGAATVLTVSAVDGSGVFTTTSTSLLKEGQAVVVSGTTANGSIASYSNPTTYWIHSILSGTTFRLSTTAGGGGAWIGSTAGNLTGLTFTAYSGAKVVGVNGTTVFLTRANGAASSTSPCSFREDRADNLTLGMVVSQTASPNGVGAYTSAAGATGSGTTITVAATAGLQVGMRVRVTAGVGQFAQNTVVTAVNTATTFTVSSAPIVALSGGASVVKGETVIVGISKIYPATLNNGSVVEVAGHRLHLSNNLVANITTASGNDSVLFDCSKVTTSAPHGLVAGDIIYLERGTGNSTTAPDTYTVHSVASTTEFTTTPALFGTGSCTLYSSIMYAERFTNGPYAIQNNGDQIKITLNISLA